MKILFLLIAILVSSNLFSQITLTSSNNPSPGNTMLSIDCDTAGISEGNSGANQTWSYPTLSRHDSISFHWVAASSTPYGSQFSTSNIASTFNDTDYSYFTTSSSSFISNGLGAPGLVIPYSDPQTNMQYPFTYSNSFTDSYAASFSAGGITVFRNGTTTVTCDAWGTLILPGGTFPNSIRVKYIDVSRDSSNPGAPIVLRSTNTSYSWYVSNKKFPVFQIGYYSGSFNGIPQPTTKSVIYYPNNPTIGIVQLSSIIPDQFNLMQNYPNPFNPQTKIRFDVPSASSNLRLVVFDELGREIAVLVNQNLSPGSYEVKWDATNLSAGVYYYRLFTENFTETKKMLLIK